MASEVAPDKSITRAPIQKTTIKPTLRSRLLSQQGDPCLHLLLGPYLSDAVSLATNLRSKHL